jgi:hypothetical protein
VQRCHRTTDPEVYFAWKGLLMFMTICITSCITGSLLAWYSALQMGRGGEGGEAGEMGFSETSNGRRTG